MSDIHIYIRYSILMNGDKDWNDKKSLRRSWFIMNLEIFVVNALDRISCGYVLMTARSAIGAQ